MYNQRYFLQYIRTCYVSPIIYTKTAIVLCQNKRFNLIVIIALIIAFVVGFLIQSQERPVIDIEAKKIPDSLVKVMARKKNGGKHHFQCGFRH